MRVTTNAPSSVFQSTHLLRGATESASTPPHPLLFQSTHLLRGATVREDRIEIRFQISIHAPLARCDVTSAVIFFLSSSISIHAPLARCDVFRTGDIRRGSDFNPRTSCEVRQINTATTPPADRFQSTHLLRGATW